MLMEKEVSKENQVSDKRASQGGSPSGGKRQLAIILVRGLVGVSTRVKEALTTLRLRKKHACVVVEDTPAVRGQLLKCKDYVTYGTITPETKQLLEARGAKNGVYHLPPPRGGWKSTKKGFNAGGALGDRGAMDELLKKIL